MKTLKAVSAAALLCCAALGANASEQGGQGNLQPIVEQGGRELRFDWPMLKIASAYYQEGPTGVTVFKFDRKVMTAVDVRGGIPGTVNTDALRSGSERPRVDTIIFSGGSNYGLETITAAQSAMKDSGYRGARGNEIATSTGAIINDLGARRLSEVYPDKALAYAAYNAVESGVFRLGAAGAGRSAQFGGLFDCRARGGQGAAFRQIGDLKIAVFTIVNAAGLVVRRDGSLAACYGDKAWPRNIKVQDILAGLPESMEPGWTGPHEATTVSLVVVNQKMAPSALQRLAVQVHTSMARAIQPFATQSDGDALFAVSTGEFEPPEGFKPSGSVALGTIVSELMWDAVLSAVPPQPALTPVSNRRVGAEERDRAVGTYQFSPNVSVSITSENGSLRAQAVGAYEAFAIPKETTIALSPTATTNDFTIPGRYPLLLRFAADGALVINPGPWAQLGTRVK